MKIRVVGGGWYGCYLTHDLLRAGHEVELHEIDGRLFAGASGNNPARLHCGAHYPRSRITRAFCQDHHDRFMAEFGDFTRGIACNIYAIAEHDSLVDFGTYKQVLRNNVEFIEVERPGDFGLQHVEGAILTGERHIRIQDVRAYFTEQLRGHVKLGEPAGDLNDPRWDLTIDCTFCALDTENIDRYEPCLMLLLEGPTDRAVTIMDGPFPSIYPWLEPGTCSLTSARWTPFSKTCRTWQEARSLLDGLARSDLIARGEEMLESMAHFWPEVRDRYEKTLDYRTSIRAMPRSGADARLVDIVRVGERALRVRAGKIDAIFAAAERVREMIDARQ